MEHNKPIKILLADDDPDDLEFLTFLFNSNESFEITDSLYSGTQVFKSIAEAKPDVLVIDMYMPMMTGAEVVDRLVQDETLSTLNIFILSTTINMQEQQKYQDNPNIRFLLKPSSLTELNDLPGILLEKLNLDNKTKV
ncbi:response regulator [Flavobacterium sp.]|uniref:response regulator n=1 Tax=Flavobacterium sp. TaxID=239 RepID=UPI0026260EC6|nr:response regulator [Flavobacterium sp.]